MRLVWLSINASYSHSSLALPLLHQAAQSQSSWTWQKLESSLGDNPGELALRLSELQADLLCCSLFLFNCEFVYSILQRFRVLHPHCVIIAGGPECLGPGAVKVLQNCSAIDLAISGEGEAILPKIMQIISQGDRPRGLPGMAWREAANGKIAARELQPPLQYQAWPNDSPPCMSEFFATDKPFVQMETTRGCPHGCSYCSSNRTQVRSKSLQQVEQELKLLSQKGVQEIRLLDRTFNLPEKRALQLLQMFRLQFPQLKFHLEIHPQYLGAELREELKLANPGQLHLEAGIQSLQDEVLQALGREASADKSLQGLEFLSRCKAFETHADLLAGLPKQSYNNIVDDVKRLIALGPAEIQLEILKVLPGTPLQTQAETLGLRHSPEPPYEILQTALLSPRELRLASALSRLIDLFYNQQKLQAPFRLACAENDGFIDAFMLFLTNQGFSAQWTGSLAKRYSLFAEFCQEGSAQLKDCLALHWLKAGLPQGETPYYKPEALSEMPPNCLLLEGRQETQNLKNTRLFLLRGLQHHYVFAFNRAIAMQQPCALWKCRNSPAN
ncbi:MAG: DUF4080 domain-containing protein [Lentisphaeria bacterium]|jgi:hypothetical protein|nr:DUF4080 domain-containing protein [Lentisphaeria bacterium]MDY0176830.1 DUF4080 domain-containing protein [Lentisphaeria bacterium]